MFTKVKTEHHILKEFHKFLKKVEKIPEIQRIIPGRVAREQSGRGERRVNFSYLTRTGLKYKICKGSTAQEIFVIVIKGTEEIVKEKINVLVKEMVG